MNLFKNYTKVYFRRFRKQTTHFLVNILGLGLGFAVLFFILMFVYDAQNMDAFHSKSDRLYRIIERSEEEDGIHEYISTAGPLADAMKRDFPAVIAAAHITNSGSQVIAKGDNRITDREWAIVTADLFDMMDISIVAGNPKKETNGPAGLVLSEDAAMRLFGDTNVVGEVVDDSRFGSIEVVAIMKELPRNSSYQFKELYVTNYKNWPEGWREFYSGWENRFTSTWVLLEEGASPQDIYEHKDAFLAKYHEEEYIANHDFYLQRIDEMHLNSAGIESGGMAPYLSIPASSQQFVSIILMLGFLVLLIAALNYINLSSVQALKRTLEASMRKINGAQNSHLVGQLFFETFLTVLFSYAFAIFIVISLFPYFQQVANKDLDLSLLYSRDFIPIHICSILLIWFISAILPSLYYAKLKRSLLVLKNAFSGKGDMLRKVLVGVQYALTLFLIVGSIVIFRQLNYIQNKDLGFDRSNLIVLDINSGAARGNFKNIIQGIRKSADVLNVSTSSRVPGEWKNIPTANVATDLLAKPLEVSHYAIDHNWLDTYEMELLKGRNFTGLDKQDSLTILVNEELVKALGIEDPIGSSIWVSGTRDTVRMRIVGIVGDFHFESLYEPIGPVVLTTWNNHIRSIDYFTVRYARNPKETIEHIEKVNATFDPQTPAEINFLDDQWNRFYRAEASRGRVVLIASVLSILISAFGLFGLINFTVERKTKEIGIRKVMGASLANILNLILKDYLILLVISMLLAAPFSFWVFKSWLSDFAYRINIGIDLYLFALLIVLAVSFFTVLIRIFRVAQSDPVQSIRYE